MTRYEFGDVLLVPFPFTDQSAVKKRPAVVVSSAAFHREQSNVIVIAVSSVTDALGGVGTVAVTEWKKAGLLEPSVIRPAITTMSTRLVIRKLGKLGPKDQEALRRAIPQAIG